MKAMILAAGLGTRFKPWTDNHPKALALVNGKSLLERNILYLQSFGIKDVIVNVHGLLWRDQYLKLRDCLGRVCTNGLTVQHPEALGDDWMTSYELACKALHWKRPS